jgi:hypothetical protein
MKLRIAALATGLNEAEGAPKDELEACQLVISELTGKIEPLRLRRVQIINERADIYKLLRKQPPPAPVSDDDRAGRRQAEEILREVAPEISLPQEPPEVGRDRALLREQKAVDLAMKALENQRAIAQATMVVVWDKKMNKEWCGLVRADVLDRVRSAASSRRMAALFEKRLQAAGYGDNSDLPLIGMLDGRDGVALSDLTKAALAAGVITPTEIREAENG